VRFRVQATPAVVAGSGAGLGVIFWLLSGETGVVGAGASIRRRVFTRARSISQRVWPDGRGGSRGSSGPGTRRLVCCWPYRPQERPARYRARLRPTDRGPPKPGRPASRTLRGHGSTATSCSPVSAPFRQPGRPPTVRGPAAWRADQDAARINSFLPVGQERSLNGPGPD